MVFLPFYMWYQIGPQRSQDTSLSPDLVLDYSFVVTKGSVFVYEECRKVSSSP